jgi:hypothetical protein
MVSGVYPSSIYNDLVSIALGIKLQKPRISDQGSELSLIADAEPPVALSLRRCATSQL